MRAHFLHLHETDVYEYYIIFSVIQYYIVLYNIYI